MLWIIFGLIVFFVYLARRKRARIISDDKRSMDEPYLRSQYRKFFREAVAMIEADPLSKSDQVKFEKLVDECAVYKLKLGELTGSEYGYSARVREREELLEIIYKKAGKDGSGR